MRMVSRALIARILEQYALEPSGPHGLAHWARVLSNGRRLAESTGASLAVVELFSVFHDACRLNNAVDHGHGTRGAQLAAKLRGTHFELSDGDFDLLRAACVDHTAGTTEADVTVQTCWDADRLDLWRVGIHPRPELLCTSAARRPETMAWAQERSEEQRVPGLVRVEWGLDLDE